LTGVYSLEDAHLLERELCAIFPSEWLREKAKATGLIKRERKIDPVTIFLGSGNKLWDFSATNLGNPEAQL
jgi:hypothetical protein